jgi:acyl dehydratase
VPIDPDVAIGAELPERRFSWTASDVLLYHLALGATELPYAYERDLRVLPTFGVVAPTCHDTEPPVVSFPGVEVDLAKALHGGQEIIVHRPLPVAGSAVARGRIADVLDKGSAAVIVRETVVCGDDGLPLWTDRSTVFARGEGGFGGRRGGGDRPARPDGPPDAELLTPTLARQALWYRLCGDRNPLHADPEFAAAAGFPAPILHGLCTYGMVAKALVDGVLDGAVDRVAGLSARFAGVVFPGETLRTRVWRRDGTLIAATTAVERDDAPVLADVVLAHR